MNLPDIKYNVILSSVIFSVIFAVASYFIIGITIGVIYKVIIFLVLVILYANFMRLFVLETFNLKRTRISERLNYFIMYVVTIFIISAPFFLEPVNNFEMNIVRILIISFASILLIKYFIYSVLGPLQDIVYEIVHHKKFSHKKYTPLVSVVIPAWNEEVGIIQTLESVLNSEYRKIEIVIVNDGSTDSSDEKIKDFIKKYNKSAKGIKIKYFYQDNKGKGGALNKAIELSSGEIMVSIDADCIVSKEAISEFVETFKNEKVMAAVGNVKIGNNLSTIGMVQYLEFLFSFYFKRAESLMGSIYIIGGAAGAFRREVFEKVGGYSTTNITEDIELTVRIQEAGMKIVFVPKAVVYTEGASDIESLKSQRLRWKRGRFQTFFQYKHLFFSLKKKHNKFLTLFVMPLAILQEIQLLLEIPFLIFLYSLSVINNDYTSFFSGFIVVGVMFVVQTMFFEKSTRNIGFVLLAPIGWLIFYIATYIEATALVKSITGFIFKKDIRWQVWDRKGLVSIENKI